MRQKAPIAPALLLIVLLVPVVLAHVPLGGGENHTLDTAILIPDIGKSFTVFSDLHEAGEGRYYKFEARAGDRILIVLQVSLVSGREGLEPTLALMGPSLSTNASLPQSIEAPEGAGIVSVDGVLPMKVYYEGFSPAVFYRVATLDVVAPSTGTYYFVVYGAEEGNFNFAVGYREEFTPSEWLTVPLNQLDIYQWEGQQLFIIMLPMITVVVAGLLIPVWRLVKIGSRLTPFLVTSLLAGLLFLGSSAMTLYQMSYCLYFAGVVPEAVITLIFALIPLILAILTLRISLRSTSGVGKRERMFMAIIGVFALFFWAGLYLGPTLALLSSVLPAPGKSRGILDAAAGN